VMSPPSSSDPRSSRSKLIVAAGLLLLILVSLASVWLYRRGFQERELQIVERALAEGRLDESSQALARLLAVSPNSAKAHYFKARIAWAQNDLATVDEETVRAFELGYERAPLARLRGLLLALSKNQKSEAEVLLREVFDSSRELDTEVAEALARIYLGTFQLGEAAAVLDRWSREVPGDARPYLMRIEIDTRTQAAREVVLGRYHAALERDPNLDKARFGLAELLRISHRNTEAAQEYGLYLARKPDDPLGYAGAGQNALDMGDVADAARLLDHSLALAPRNAVVQAARGAVELRRGNLEAALGYLDQAAKSDPFDHGNRYQRMLILASLGKKAEAEAERQAVERLKNDQTRFSQIRHELLDKPLDAKLRAEAACWLMEHGHEDEAIEWANLVLGTDPSHPAMNRLLADYYRKKGQLGLANFHETHAEKSSDRGTSTHRD
jgi:tetratricopeptide (TPR) repeat protein